MHRRALVGAVETSSSREEVSFVTSSSPTMGRGANAAICGRIQPGGLLRRRQGRG
jgi:hypothetical protein